MPCALPVLLFSVLLDVPARPQPTIINPTQPNVMQCNSIQSIKVPCFLVGNTQVLLFYNKKKDAACICNHLYFSSGSFQQCSKNVFVLILCFKRSARTASALLGGCRSTVQRLQTWTLHPYAPFGVVPLLAVAVDL